MRAYEMVAFFSFLNSFSIHRYLLCVCVRVFLLLQRISFLHYISIDLSIDQPTPA